MTQLVGLVRADAHEDWMVEVVHVVEVTTDLLAAKLRVVQRWVEVEDLVIVWRSSCDGGS